MSKFFIHFLHISFDFRIIIRDTKDESDGVANVVSLVRDDDVDVIFGSPSSRSKSSPYTYLTNNGTLIFFYSIFFLNITSAQTMLNYLKL